MGNNNIPLVVTPTLDQISDLEKEYLQYVKTARRCGFWPFRTKRIIVVEFLLESAGRLQAVASQMGSEAV